MIVLQAIIIIAVVALLVLGFLRRNMPRVGGKLGPIRTVDPPRELPGGFSRTYTRAVSLFVASVASRFATLKAFLRDGTARLPVVMRIYCVAGCKARSRFPNRSPIMSASMRRKRLRCCANCRIRVAFTACI